MREEPKPPVKQLIVFLLVIILMVAGAVYFHFSREEQSYSDVFFSQVEI